MLEVHVETWPGLILSVVLAYQPTSHC